MQIVHTAALPPNQGRMTLAMSGCTWKSRKALRKMVMRAAGWRRRIARCSGRYAERSERAGVDAAVDQEILAGNVARLHAAQIGAELAELLGRAEAARGNRLLDVPPHLFHGLAFLLRGELGVALQPVGPEAPGEQVVDRDVVCDGRAREARDEAGEAAPRAVRERELRDRGLHRARSDVDDAPEAPRDHPVHRRLDQLDGSDHVGAYRLQPVLARELAEIPGRRAARVGDEDVGLRACGERRDAALFAGDVRRHGDDRRARRGADLIGGFLQCLALARDEGDAAAFARQRRRASPAEPLACAAYERGLAANFQVHDFSEKEFVLAWRDARMIKL